MSLTLYAVYATDFLVSRCNKKIIYWVLFRPFLGKRLICAFLMPHKLCIRIIKGGIFMVYVFCGVNKV
jgi:hypothetical protein